MLQVVKMSDDEKRAMYMEMDKEKLVEMKIAEEHALEIEEAEKERLWRENNMLRMHYNNRTECLIKGKPQSEWHDWLGEQLSNFEPWPKDSDIYRYILEAFIEALDIINLTHD